MSRQRTSRPAWTRDEPGRRRHLRTLARQFPRLLQAGQTLEIQPLEIQRCARSQDTARQCLLLIVWLRHFDRISTQLNLLGARATFCTAQDLTELRRLRRELSTQLHHQVIQLRSVQPSSATDKAAARQALSRLPRHCGLRWLTKGSGYRLLRQLYLALGGSSEERRYRQVQRVQRLRPVIAREQTVRYPRNTRLELTRRHQRELRTRAERCPPLRHAEINPRYRRFRQ